MKALASYIALCLLAGLFVVGAVLALPGLVLVVWAVVIASRIGLFSGAGAAGPWAPHKRPERGAAPRPASNPSVPLKELLDRSRLEKLAADEPLPDEHLRHGLRTTSTKGAN